MSISTLIMEERRSYNENKDIDLEKLNNIHHATEIYDEMNRRTDKIIDPKVWDNNIENMFNISTKTINFREHIDYSWREFIRRIERRDERNISMIDQIPKGKSWQCFSSECKWSKVYNREIKLRECPECGHPRPYLCD